MGLPEDCVRLKIYVGEGDRWEHKPLYEAIVIKAREFGMAGATVFRSPLGFGANSVIRAAKVLNLSTDLPMIIEIVDTEDKARAYVEELQREMLKDGLVTMESIKVLHYQHNDGN